MTEEEGKEVLIKEEYGKLLEIDSDLKKLIKKRTDKIIHINRLTGLPEPLCRIIGI